MNTFLKSGKNISRKLLQAMTAISATTFTRLNDHSTGHPDAAIELIEYVDLQCPYCFNTHFIIDKLLHAFDGRIRFTFRHLPNPELHPYTLLAAAAAEAAAPQGKFWEMVDQLFQHQREINAFKVYQIAENIGLRPDEFHAALNDAALSQGIMHEATEARRLGITGTPTLFINGQRHLGDWTFESLYQAITRVLPQTAPFV
jgi:Na+:H+ antiporter, NhaA family